MAMVTDYTGILYTADGGPENSWNAITELGAPVIVTYKFVTGTELDSWEANSPYPNSGYTAFTTAQRANFRDALALFSAAAGVVFVEVTGGAAMVNAMVTSGSSYGGWAAVALAMETHTNEGDLVVDNSGNFDEGSYAFQTMLHELGHAMGLQHPFEGDIQLDGSVDNQAHTVMTYNIDTPYARILGTLDVQALQALYGTAAAVAGWAVSWAAGVLTVTGTLAADRILGALGANLLNGGGGADRLNGRQADDTLNGGAGDDSLFGNVGSDRLLGDDGNDALWGFGARNLWVAGEDSLYGGAGRDTLTGGNRADLLIGGAGGDVINGRDGSDTMRGGGGADRIYGGAAGVFSGNQRLYGDAGADRLSGGDGTDLLYGGTEADTLDGGAGRDRLYGGDGDDVLQTGGSGYESDDFTGGAGADRFVFVPGDAGSNIYVADFTRGEDKIDLTALATSWAGVGKSGAWLIVGTLWINTTVTAQIDASDFLF